MPLNPHQEFWKMLVFPDAKIWISLERLVQFKKQTHSEILLLRAFKWAINEIFLKKLKFSVDTLLIGRSIALLGNYILTKIYILA